jgi:hypothetical protein
MSNFLITLINTRLQPGGVACWRVSRFNGLSARGGDPFDSIAGQLLLERRRTIARTGALFQTVLIPTMSEKDKNRFETAGRGNQAGILGEVFQMLRQNKKYWLILILLVLLALGAVVLLSGTAVAPFIYTLF